MLSKIQAISPFFSALYGVTGIHKALNICLVGDRLTWVEKVKTCVYVRFFVYVKWCFHAGHIPCCFVHTKIAYTYAYTQFSATFKYERLWKCEHTYLLETTNELQNKTK